MPLLNRYFLVFLAGIVASGLLSAQDKSNKGKEFWLGYGHNVLFTQDPPVNSQTHVLYLSAEQAATVTVSVNGTGWSQTVSIPANSVDASVIIPKSGPDDARLTSDGLSDRGIHIVSNVPIVAYSHQYGLFSSAATMLMPVETFGYTYYSLNYNQVSNYTDSYSWFYAVASENNTRIRITPSDSTEGGWLPGQTYTVNLNKGQIYNIFGKRTGSLTGKDMTGSKLVSVPGADGICHPIGVFSGSSRNVICTGNGGEILQQQIFPANAWGTRYVTYHTVNGISNPTFSPFVNYYRVAVRNPSTVVKRNGVPLTGLINNFYYEFSGSSGDYIEADQPILVAQYIINSNECAGTSNNVVGDPEMIYLSPIEQGVKNAIFYSTRNQAIDYNFINIITPYVAVPSLRIDGLPLTPAEFITHPANSNYAVAVKRLTGPAAQHSVTGDSGFVAIVYGVGSFESYGYNMGTFVNNLNAYSQIRNTFNTNNQPDSFTCPKSPFRIQVQLAYRAASIHWKLSQVPGLNPATDSIILNPVPSDSPYINQRKYYTYTLQQDFNFTDPGAYYIPVTYSAPEIDACNQTETTTIKIVVKPGPLPNFSFNDPACLADSIRFTGTSVSGTFNLIRYNWLFDDNSTVSSVSTVKLFPVAGTQNVRYRIFADNGCIGDTIKTITVNPSPVASFSVNGSPFCEGNPVTISSSATGIGSWNWTLGTTNSMAVPPFSHSFNAGTHTIGLFVKTTAGCPSDTVGQNITIYPVPIVNAGPDTTIRVGSSVMLNASINPPGNYTYTWSPAVFLNSSGVLNPVSTPQTSTLYTLRVVDPLSSCSASDNVLVTTVAGLYIPNVFTPNNDGRNDQWLIPGLALYPGASVMIFNRWGEKILETKDYFNNPWNGTYKGLVQPAGVYVFLIRLNDEQKQMLKGSVTLIR
jgi:gliding motility-associated-like protein